MAKMVGRAERKQIKMTDFTLKVIRLIQEIPPGRVATYGQIAKLAGKPNGSLGVGWILHSCTASHELPWQRVLGSLGKISFPAGTSQFTKQRRLLQSEQVLVSLKGRVDLEKFGWKKTLRQKKIDKNQPQMFRS